MLTIKYITVVDFPGIPAGEEITKITGEHIYRGTQNQGFWADEKVVENDTKKYTFVSVSDGSDPITDEKVAAISAAVAKLADGLKDLADAKALPDSVDAAVAVQVS